MTDPRLAEPVEKTEKAVKLVMRRLIKLRRSGRVPYGWIEDMSRRGYHVATYDDTADFLRNVASLYRTDLWQQTDYYVEVWCESRSIAGVILGLCKELGVSLYPAGGNTSISLAYQAACGINEWHDGRQVVVFYVGDYDQAGVIIDKAIERELLLHLDKGIRLQFARVAITKQQIRRYNLPTKPRKVSDKRSPEVKATVEAEAMPPALLQQILRKHIEELLPSHALNTTRAEDETGRMLLRALADGLNEAKAEADDEGD
jgi:hypothetical protein